VFNGDGSVSLNFSIATAPAGTVVHVSASVSPATGQGTWSDDLGHSGTFAFDGSIAGLPVRPSSPTVLSVADNPQLPNDPCAVPTARPTMVLCGTAAGHWGNGGYGLAGPQVWRDRDGRVHIRGSVYRSAGSIALPVFVLPAAFVPRQTLALTVSTGLNAGVHLGGTALLVIYGADQPGAAGLVLVASPSIGAHSVVHFGELVFSVDP
jgi:hypothetical protein